MFVLNRIKGKNNGTGETLILFFLLYLPIQYWCTILVMTDPMLTPHIEKMRDEFVLRIFTEFKHMSNRTPCGLTSVSLLFINSKLLYSILQCWKLSAVELLFSPHLDSSFSTSSVAFLASLRLSCDVGVSLRMVPSLSNVYPPLLLGVFGNLALHILS